STRARARRKCSLSSTSTLDIEAGYHAGVRWLLLLVALAGCPAAPPRPTLEGAEQRAERGEWRAALADYDAIAAAAAPAGDRVRAWTAGALVCQRLGDAGGARRRLEAAVAADVAGESEPAMYHLAELVRGED